MICSTDEERVVEFPEANIVATVRVLANTLLTGSNNDAGVASVIRMKELNIRVECIVFPGWVSRDERCASFVRVVLNPRVRCRPATPERSPV